MLCGVVIGVPMGIQLSRDYVVREQNSDPSWLMGTSLGESVRVDFQSGYTTYIRSFYKHLDDGVAHYLPF